MTAVNKSALIQYEISNTRPELSVPDMHNFARLAMQMARLTLPVQVFTKKFRSTWKRAARLFQPLALIPGSP